MSNKIRIISTSDVHGKVLPFNYGTGEQGEFGFAKLASLIKTLKDENTILIDNGDTLEGSPLQLFHMKEKMKDENMEPSPVSKAMNHMGYDIINLGNHDFDYGMDVLKHHIESTGAKCVNLNAGYDYDIREVAGKRIAIFGVLTHFTTRWEDAKNLEGANFPDTFTLVSETAKRIKEESSPDYIICCYHGGFEKDPQTLEPIGKDTGENQGYRMLEEIPEIDILIAGHQHSVSCGIYKGKAYTQPGMDGRILSSITIDTESNEIIPRLYHLEEEKVFSEWTMMEMLAQEEEECQLWLDEPIGESKIDLLVHEEGKERLEKNQFITFLNKVQMERTGAELSSSSLFTGALGLGPTITMRQIVCSYAFPNTLNVKKISGKVLKEYLEKDMEYWESDGEKVRVSPDYLNPIPKDFNYDIIDGVEYEAEIHRPIGERIVSLKRNGIDVKEDDYFTIVLNSYRASGGGDFEMLPLLETVKQDTTNMVDALYEYISQAKVIDFEPINNIKIKP